MKISCQVIKDLLPLYYDKICSDDSKQIVEEHLKGCIKCQEYFKEINEEIFQNNTLEIKKEELNLGLLKSLKKKLFKKNFMIAIISILCTLTLLLGTYSMVFYYEIPIKYHNNLINVEPTSNNEINIRLNRNDYACSYELSKTIEKDGVKENALFLYYTDSIWTKYFSQLKPKNRPILSINNGLAIDGTKNGETTEILEDIDAVYYLVGNYTNLSLMSNEDFTKASKDATLLWKK